MALANENKQTCFTDTRQSLSALALLGFVVAGFVALLSYIFLPRGWGWLQPHTIRHYLYGLGFPLFWVGIFSLKRSANRKAWQAAWDRHVFQHLGAGLWLGIFITCTWSIWNEIFVYQVFNPAHSPDWHHWIADQLGAATAVAFFFAIRRHVELQAVSSPGRAV